MTGVILILIFLAVMFAVRYLMRRPDLLARGLMWVLMRRQRRGQQERRRESRRTHNPAAGSRSPADRPTWSYGREPIIPREYAQDVEYEEVKGVGRVAEPVHTRVESQVSDAEWEEIV